MPAILQRKPKIVAMETENKDDDTNVERSIPATMIVTIKNSIQSVLKNLNRIILVKPLAQTVNPNIQPSITIIPSDENGIEEKLSNNVDNDDGDDNKYATPKDEQQEVKILKEEEIEQFEQNELEETSADYPCDSCDESFVDRSALIIHKTEKSIVRTRAALREPVVKYTCDLCKRLFASKGMLERHYKNCGVLELDSLPSNYRRRRVRNRDQTKRDKENEEAPATCAKCNKVFKKGKYLKVHQTMAHGEHVACQLCEARLESMAQLKAHMSQVHSGDFTEFCQICNKGFYFRQSLKVHLAAHMRDDKPCICTICQKSFRHEVYLRKHVQIVHVELRDRKKYRCDECGYETHYKNCFREHVYKHTGEDQVECEVCQKRIRRGYMRLHKRIHTGEKPEICEYCGKGFSARKYLMKHRVTHTGEKPYQCQICGKRYTQRGTLTLHFRNHHPQEGICARRNQTKKEVKERIDDKDDEEKQKECQLQINEDGSIMQIVDIDADGEDEMMRVDVLEDEGELMENHGNYKEEILDETLESDDEVAKEDSEIT